VDYCRTDSGVRCFRFRRVAHPSRGSISDDSVNNRGCPALAFFARACPEPVEGVGGGGHSHKFLRTMFTRHRPS
jgi:hypothetical protein